MKNLHPSVQKLIDSADEVIYRLTKIDGENNEDYPIGYWTIGYGLFLEEDSPCFMNRIANSSYMGTRFGYFRTSKVISIERGDKFDVITTANSIYKIEQLNSVMTILGKKIGTATLNQD